MLLRILLFVVLVVVGWYLLRRVLAPRAPRERQFVPMVRCAHCGLHLPGSEAIAADGRHFCSQEHARLSRGA